MYDDKGMVKPKETASEGESGSSTPPPDASAPAKAESGAAETTAEASQPSPDAKSATASAAAPAEDKSGTAKAATDATDTGKPAATDPTKATQAADDSDAALEAKYKRADDKGPEWGIRAYRDLRAKYGPVISAADKATSVVQAARGLEFVAEFGNLESDIGAAVDKMTALSPFRTEQLHAHLYNLTLDTYPDRVATDLVGLVDAKGDPVPLDQQGMPVDAKSVVPVTVTELQQAVKLIRSGAKPGAETQPQAAATGTTPKEPQKPEGMSDDDWENLRIDYPLAYEAMKTPAAPPAPEPPKTDDSKVTELTTKLTTMEQKEAERQNEIIRTEVLNKGAEFHTQAYSVVEDGLRELGLEPDPAKDDDRTIRLKKDTAESIRKAVDAEVDGPDGPEGEMDWSLCNDEQKANRKLATLIMKLLSARDYTTAFDYLDQAKARYDLAFQRVAEPKIELFNAAMSQLSTTKSDAGQGGHARPEIVDGAAAAAAGGESKTPWLDKSFRQPGESAWDAADRWREEHRQMPGR